MPAGLNHGPGTAFVSSAFYHGERTADWTVTDVVLSRMVLSLGSCRHGTHALAHSRAETLLQRLGGPRFTDEETEAVAQHVARALQAGGEQTQARHVGNRPRASAPPSPHQMAPSARSC